MTRPNSLLTIIRRIIAQEVAPHPDPGEGWCLDCSFNSGKTLVVSAEGALDHAQKHYEKDVHEKISLDVSYPRRTLT